MTRPATHDDDDATHKAARAILRIDPNDKAAMVVFLESFRGTKSVASHEEQKDTLVQLGSRAEAAIPILCDLLLHRDDSVRADAAECLGSLSVHNEERIDALIRFLADRDRGDYRNPRSKGVEALARIGPAAVQKLIAALADEDVLIRAGAAEVLGRIEPPAEAAVGPLVKALIDPRMPVRRNAAEALGRLGSAARSAVPSLRKACQDEFHGVRRQAEAALANIGNSASSAPSTPPAD